MARFFNTASNMLISMLMLACTSIPQLCLADTGVFATANQNVETSFLQAKQFALGLADKLLYDDTVVIYENNLVCSHRFRVLASDLDKGLRRYREGRLYEDLIKLAQDDLNLINNCEAYESVWADDVTDYVKDFENLIKKIEREAGFSRSTSGGSSKGPTLPPASLNRHVPI